jgi:hypothetical protein
MLNHYRKLRSLGVRANAAIFVARLMAEFKPQPTESEYQWYAAECAKLARIPWAYSPRAER